MTGGLWAPIGSLVGVLLGGGLTFLTQRTTARVAERTEERRRASALTETRRTEQIQSMTDFLRFALQAEGIAHARPEAWAVGDEWYRGARSAMDGLRVTEKAVELLCVESLAAPASAYVRALNEAVWQQRDQTPLGEVLEPFKAAFLAVARRSLQ